MGNWASRSERIDIDMHNMTPKQYPTPKLASKYPSYDNKALAFLSSNKSRPPPTLGHFIGKVFFFVYILFIRRYFKDDTKYV